MTASIRSQIADALVARLNLVTELKYVKFDEVRLMASDFSDWEIPAVQCFDLTEINVHEMRRGRKSWTIVVEIIIGPKPTTTAPNQKELWDLMQKIEQTIFETPKLGIKEVIHAKLVTSSTDLHLMKPFYLGRLEITVDYYQHLVGEC